MTARRAPQLIDEMVSAESIVASATTLFDYLTLSIALSRDPRLVRTIRAATSAGERLSLSLGENGPFVHLVGDAVVGSSIEAPRAPSGAPADVVDLRTLLATDLPSADALALTYERTGVLPEVAGWLRSFASGGDTMSRETFRAIAAWQPVVAVEAFRQVTYASLALDRERRQLLDAVAGADVDPRALLSYWTLVHMIGNASLLATMGEEQDWLAELAANVPPGGWTPSFVLVRERCFRLGLRAGWTAAAFGEVVVPRYLDVLARAAVPLRAFDAVLGLTAIGLRHPELAPSLGREIRSALTSAAGSAASSHQAFFEAMSRSAELTLTAPSSAARLTHERAARLASLRSVPQEADVASALNGLDGDDDCAELDHGLFPCIVALAVFIPGPAEALFRSAADLGRRSKRHQSVHERARTVLLRTGIRSAAESPRRWVN